MTNDEKVKEILDLTGVHQNMENAESLAAKIIDFDVELDNVCKYIELAEELAEEVNEYIGKDMRKILDIVEGENDE